MRQAFAWIADGSDGFGASEDGMRVLEFALMYGIYLHLKFTPKNHPKCLGINSDSSVPLDITFGFVRIKGWDPWVVSP